MNTEPNQAGTLNLHDVWVRVAAEIRSAARFRWHGMALAWTLFVCGALVLASRPDVYEARARVFVDTSSVLQPILRNQIIPGDVTSQLAYVRQSLLGRGNLERVARANELDHKVKSSADLDQLLRELADEIQISTTGDARASVYRLTYHNASRDKAVGVVTTLLNSLVADTQGESEQGSDTASRFLDERIGEYEHRLQEAERVLADFKKRNADRLPGAGGDYFQRMRAARDAFEQAEKSLRVSEAQVEQIQKQLQSAVPVLPSTTQASQQLPPNSLDARIRDYRRQLDSLLLQYTEKHPDVINTRTTLATLERQRAEQLHAMGVSDSEQEISTLDSNPVYQALQISLNQAQVKVATDRADVNDRRSSVAQLQALIDEVPDVEAELVRLNRDYNVINEQYQALVRSRETQSLSQKASTAEEVVFRTIDPPSSDQKPVSPHRPLLLTALFLGSLGVGGGLTWLLAQLRPVFLSAVALRDACGIPVIGAISEAPSSERRARQRAMLRVFAVAVAGFAVVFSVAVLLEIAGPGVRSLVGLGNG